MRSPLPLRLLLLALAGLLMVAVARYPLATYLADVNPHLALRLNPGHSGALLVAAQRLVRQVELADQAEPSDPARITRFAAPSTLGENAPATPRLPAAMPAGSERLAPEARAEALREARALLDRSLAGNPLNYHAVTLRGWVEELAAGSTPPPEAAIRLYRMAARLSPRAIAANDRLMRYHFERKEFEQVAHFADLLLRTSSQARSAVMPVLANVAETPEAQHLVVNLLRSNPPWRETFFELLVNHISDARTPLALLLALKETAHPPSDANLKHYLNFLVGKNFHQLAYYTWLQFLPPERLATAGLIFNGGFTHQPTGAPFDWTIATGAGAAAEIAPLPNDPERSGLRIEFSDGRVVFRGVWQTLLLAPGTYEIAGRYQGELIGNRGLRWRLLCVGASAIRLLAETPMHVGVTPAWRDFTLKFKIPDEDCGAQILRLELDARTTSERLVRGTLWYSDLVARRLEDAPSQPPRIDPGSDNRH